MLKNIKSTNISNKAQAQIGEFIVESGLKAGDMLPTEKALEEQLGISRTSIREALRSLEAIGIIETRHGVGRFLRHFNYDAIIENLSYNIELNVKDFRDVIDIRVALEVSFLDRVIPFFTEGDIQELRDLLGQLEVEVRAQEEEQELIENHTAFHLKLYEKAGNALLLHIIRMFATLQRHLTILKRYHSSNTDEFIRLHRSLVDAIEQRDAAQAKQCLMEHFRDVIAWSDAYNHEGSDPSH